MKIDLHQSRYYFELSVSWILPVNMNFEQGELV
jgi:hypothetical protein